MQAESAAAEWSRAEKSAAALQLKACQRLHSMHDYWNAFNMFY